MSRVPYAVGSMMYNMVCTRPNISQAVSVVSKYMVDPDKEHWKAMKRIFRYLRGTANVDLVYDKASTGSRSVEFVNSDYTGDLDKRRSSSVKF
jgi:hypothetical protein